MTYHECAMIGNMLKARAIAQKNQQLNLEHRIQNLQAFENTMISLISKMAEFAKLISNSPKLKPIAYAISNIVIPTFKFLLNLPKFFLNPQSLKFEIIDKLNAIYGETKAFLNKKISDILQATKSFFNKLFKVFKKNNSDDDDTKIDDDKKIFNLKTILHKLLRKKKNNDERNNQNNR